MLETHTAKTVELLTFHQRHQSRRSQNQTLDRLISENQAKVGGTFTSAELTSFTRLAGVAAVTLTVRLPQARNPALAVFTMREATGIGTILVLLIAQNTRMTRLAAAGVGVRVDWKAGAMDTPEDGDTGKVNMEKRFKKKKKHKKHILVAITGVVDLLVTQCSRPARVACAGEAPMPCGVTVTLEAGASLTRLATWLQSLAQPLPAAALSTGRTTCPRPQSSCQVLELPIDVQVTEAAVETSAVASSCAVLQ